MDYEPFDALDDLELLDFFGAEAVECDKREGYSRYEKTDSRGVTLQLSFNVLNRYVQTAVVLGGQTIAQVSMDGARFMRRDGGSLSCEFVSRDTKTTLTVDIEPDVQVRWITLQT